MFWIIKRVVDTGCQNFPPSLLRFNATGKVPKTLVNKRGKQKLGHVLYFFRGLIILTSVSILQHKGKEG